jgi:23S rRNA-/tRNA-specific pseudouridylate synthase
MFRLLSTGIISLLTTGALLAAETPEWEKALQDQLMRQQQCQLTYLTNLKTFEQPGHKSVEARAHCTDGRAFDIDNREDPRKFNIRACGPVVC